MCTFFIKYIATIIMGLLGVTILLASLLFQLDLFEVFIDIFDTLEHLEFDEFIIPVFLFLSGITIDSLKNYRRKQKLMQISEMKLEYLHTIIRTVQDIVGNSMNNLVFYSMEAKDTGKLSAQSIREIDKLIENTTQAINKLANAKAIYEKPLGDNMSVLEPVENQITPP